jgi:hypothetical protein
MGTNELERFLQIKVVHRGTDFFFKDVEVNNPRVRYVTTEPLITAATTCSWVRKLSIYNVAVYRISWYAL